MNWTEGNYVKHKMRFQSELEVTEKTFVEWTAEAAINKNEMKK